MTPAEEAIPLAMPAGQALAYASPTHAKPLTALYHVAHACWIVPLAVGLATLLIFVLTRNTGWMAVGTLTIFGGTCAFCVGMVCLAVFKFTLRSCAPDVRAKWEVQANFLFAWLLLNFPIALCCGFVAALLER